MATIQGIYIALFGRPADPLGLDYFNGVTDGGADLSEIGDLSTQPEYLSRFEGMNNVQIVTSIYQELFGRNPDAAGLAFFTAQLNSGAQNINTIAINILDGAQGDDAALVAAKIAAADQFTAAVRADPDALAAYHGQNGIDFGQAFINQIDSSDDVLTAEQVAAQVTAFGDGEQSIPGLPGTPGSILTLTADADVVSTTTTNAQFQSTANDDTIRAIAANSLGTNDVINGGAGFDTLNISDGAIAAGAAPVISNVEVINNSDNGTAAGIFTPAAPATLNLANVSGAQQVWSVGSGGANRFNYTNASLDTIFGAREGAAARTIDVNIAASTAGAADVLKIAVDDNNASVATFTSTDDAASIEGLSIIALGDSGAAGVADAVNVAAFNNVENITVTGAGNIAITADGSDLDTFNAGAATGTVALTLTNSDEDTTLTFGAGNDTLSAAAATGDLTVNGGAGNDTITTGAGDDTIVGGAGNDIIVAGGGNDTITGGAGVDTLTGGAGEDTFVYTAQSDSVYTNFDTINAFVAGTDTLDFSALNLAGNLATVAAGSTTNTTIGQFAGGVADFFNVGGEDLAVARFYDGVNTYVFADVDGNGNFDAGSDLVVQLTGNVVVTAADVNFG